MAPADVTAGASTRSLIGLVLIILASHLAMVSVNGLSIKLDRATARTLLIDILCGSSCAGNFTWEYKASPEATWSKPPRMREHYLNPYAHYVTGLPFNTLHYIRVRQDPGGVYSNEVKARTCPELLPMVTDLRVADAGPGWLDIRWTPPQEECLGRYYYHIRYKAGNLSFSDRKTYGYYNKDDSLASVNPSHPCDPMAKEFCVLLTDKVRAGMTHVVELQAERIGGADDEVSEKQNLLAFADPTNTGPSDVEICADGKSLPDIQGESNGGIDDSNPRRDPVGGEVALPLWVAALLGTVFFLALATIFGLWLGFSTRSAAGNKEKRFENLRRPSVECPAEERYVRHENISSLRTSNIYEGCDNEAPVYEEIGVQFCGQTPSDSSAVKYKSEKCS